MSRPTVMKLSYFPGCSLATTARESNQSLIRACQLMGLELVELHDWNCCGSSSAHSLDQELGLALAARNLALAPPERPLLIMCPGCFKNLFSAQVHLKRSPDLRRAQERKWGAPISPELKIVNFLEILRFFQRMEQAGLQKRLKGRKSLAGLRIAPYYGCMNMLPPDLRRAQPSAGLMEEPLQALGARPVSWPESNRCCGTYLSATRPDIATPLVNRIMQSAITAGAECLVTACAMCQLNVEIRTTLEQRLPILHFSEIFALALGASEVGNWFGRHLVDPMPLLRQKGLV